jgi:phosphoribosylformylglycinamidine synthase
LGVTVYLKNVPRTGPLYRDDYVLFSESNSRFLVEIDPDSEARFIKIMEGVPMAAIGHVSHEETLKVFGLNDEEVLNTPLSELKEAWQQPLNW